MSISDAFEFYSSLECYATLSSDGKKQDLAFHSLNPYKGLSLASSLVYPVSFQVPLDFIFKRDFLSLDIEDLYKGSFSFYYNNQRHRNHSDGPAYSDGKGRIEYWHRGFRHRPIEEGPAVRDYDLSKRKVFYSYYRYGKLIDQKYEGEEDPCVGLQFEKYLSDSSEFRKKKGVQGDLKENLYSSSESSKNKDTRKKYLINPWDNIF